MLRTSRLKTMIGTSATLKQTGRRQGSHQLISGSLATSWRLFYASMKCNSTGQYSVLYPEGFARILLLRHTPTATRATGAEKSLILNLTALYLKSRAGTAVQLSSSTYLRKLFAHSWLNIPIPEPWRLRDASYRLNVRNGSGTACRASDDLSSSTTCYADSTG